MQKLIKLLYFFKLEMFLSICEEIQKSWRTIEKLTVVEGCTICKEMVEKKIILS